MGPYIVTVYYTTGVAHTNHKNDGITARKDYQKQITLADRSNGIESVTLTRGTNPGCLLRRWVKGRDRLPVHLKYAYKIHGVVTANGESRSANTGRFYETEDEALRAAENMVKRAGQSTEGVVIYKAFRVVRPLEPQVIIEDVEV